VFLAGVVPLLAYYFARKAGQGTKRVKIAKLFPMFVAGFLAMAVFRSIGEAGASSSTKLAFGLWAPETWSHLVKFLGESVASSALGAAMAAVGLTTSLKALRVLGLKPLYVGAASAMVVGCVGLCLAALVGPRIHLGVSPAIAAPPPPAAPAPRLLPQVETPPIAAAADKNIRRPLDSDGDGIIDTYDACTKAPGPESNEPAKNGCPMARIENGQVVMLEPIRFHGKTDKMTAASRPILFAILQLLQDHEEIKKVSIKSFTDNRGTHHERYDLTHRRALAVRHWLTTHHVPRSRMQVKALAGTQPIDSNDTKEGRRHNQRIEIDVVDSAEEFAQ
jgi:outer membrane protein OmpA-like peptidoglycan-associated protein